MPGRGVEVGIGASGLAPRKVEFAADPLSLFYIPTTGRPQLRIIGREVSDPAIITVSASQPGSSMAQSKRFDVVGAIYPSPFAAVRDR